MYNSTREFKKIERFHCPYDNCLYREGSERFFKSPKELKQHIGKVHAEKKFLCAKCSKGFGTEWQKGYHERTCGIEWKCTCGEKYNRRETLLTHQRRTQHDFPEDLVKPKRLRLQASGKSNIKEPTAVSACPMIIVYPVNQTIIYTNHDMLFKAPNPNEKLPSVIDNTLPRKRVLLPKISTAVPAPKLTPSPQPKTGLHNVVVSSLPIITSIYSESNETPTSSRSNSESSRSNLLKMSNCIVKIPQAAAAATQTTQQPVESKACQCSHRPPNNLKSNRRSHRGTSIETQTIESIVGKLKSSLHSKSRNSTKPLKKNTAAQSVWSCLNTLLTTTLSRSSSGTQTSVKSKVHRSTCASQTQEGSPLSSEQAAREMLGLLATVCQHLKEAKETKSESSSVSPPVARPEALSKEDPQTVITDLLQVENLKQVLTGSNFSLDEPETMTATSSNDVESGTSLTNIETQTCTMNYCDYISSNMETQTSEDTLLDLELSHIQTQTPWDFLDFGDDLNTNQLSADIQTDITGEDFSDIFEDALWTSNTGTSLTDVTDMETQTHGQLQDMELISSYTQTLDNSLQLDLPILK